MLSYLLDNFDKIFEFMLLLKLDKLWVCEVLFFIIGVWVQYFYCDYGFNIYLDKNFYSNHNLVILDANKVEL